jgi:glutathione S-transferase
MRLDFSPGACSLAPHIALREGALPFELVRVNVAKRQLPDGGDFDAINPLGHVPVLALADGELLTEGPALLQFIADQASAAALAPPAGTRERTRMQSWLAFINSELHQGLGQLFNPSLHASTREAVTTRIRGRLDWAAQQLKGRSFRVGDRYSVADIYLFNILSWLRHVGLSISDWPALAEHSQQVAARPAVQAALAAEAAGA